MQAEIQTMNAKFDQIENSATMDGISIVKISNKYFLNTSMQDNQRCQFYVLPNETIIKISGTVNSIEQYSSHGQLIKRGPIEDILGATIMSFQIVSQSIALMLCTSNQLSNSYLIYQWSFITGETKYLIYQQIRNKNTYSCLNMKIFPITSIFCIIEYLQSKQVEIKISYYKYPIESKNDKPINLFQASKAPFKNIESIWQLNHSSGVVFVEADQNAQIKKIHICDLSIAQKKGNLKLLTIQTPIKFNPQILSCTLTQIWEPLPGMFYLNYNLSVNDHVLSTKLRNKYGEKAKGQSMNKVVISQQNRQKAFQSALAYYQKQRNYHMIWIEKENKFIQIDLSYQIQQKLISDYNIEIQFTSGFRNQVINYTSQSSLYDRLRLDTGPTKVQPAVYRRLDTCYVSVEDWKVFDVNTSIVKHALYQEVTKCRQYNQPKYNTKLLQEYNWQKFNDQLRVQVYTTKYRQFIYCYSTTSTFFITELINQCDDDLLLQTVNLLNK